MQKKKEKKWIGSNGNQVMHIRVQHFLTSDLILSVVIYLL